MIRPLAAARAEALRMISYRTGNDLDLDALIDVYRDSTLAQWRPVDDRDVMQRMLTGANLVVSAWDGEQLVGVARSLSDFAFSTYLADLAVRRSYQRKGIGREMVKRTQREGKTATIFLFAAPSAEPYYPHIGFSPGSGWQLTRMQRVRAGGTAARD
jgi:predicted N-acetyltransferase YhbS